MYKSLTKKILSILMIITILATDFFVLGSNLITYATDSSDIDLVAYFKENKTNTKRIEKSVKTENLSLFIRIRVNGDGYLSRGIIQIPSSNFNIKNEILSSNTYIESIEGNTVKLKQINEGDIVIIELGIEPKISETINADMLSQLSIVKLTGTYMEESYEGIDIEKETTVTLNYQPDETTQAELETDIITNKVFAVEGINQRIVQLLIKSRLSENQYPVKQTTINVDIPQLGEECEISMIALGKLATNGETKIDKKNYSYDGKKLQINLKNEVQNEMISWNKDIYDELIVTFIYPEDVDASDINIKTTSEITVYNSTNTYNSEHNAIYDDSRMVNNIIIGRTEITTEELYKGQLYANATTTEDIDVEYKTKTTLVITKTGIANEIVITEGKDAFETDKSQLDAKTKYISTEVNKEKMLEILGQEGNIEIKNGENTILINKDTEANERGNIVINHSNFATELEITTSEPVEEGILEIQHKKVITENSYTRAQLQKVKTLKTTNSIVGTITQNSKKQNIIKKSTQTSLEVKETVSKAELTVFNKGNLSTTETNEVTLGITLITDGVQYDLYKNPRIAVQLPSTVENVVFNTVPTIQNVSDNDEIVIESYEYDNVTKQIRIKITGEQTSYPEGTLSELYIPLDLSITLSKLAVTKIDTIKMMYTNANASEYYGGTTDIGIVEQNVGIQAPTGLIKYFNLNSNTNTSTSEDILQRILTKNAGDEIDFEITLVNNTESDMSNVKILGKLSTTGNLENTMETTLKSLTAQNATVYFTENANATTDIENTANGWTKEQLANAKLYLIELGALTQGSNYTASVKVQIPNEIVNGLESYTQYEVIYDVNGETKTEDSRKIGLKMVSDFEIGLIAEVGQEILSDGDSVKEGEVVRYTTIVKNNTDQALENVQFKADVPEGTVLVEPVEHYVYVADPFYYEEKTDVSEINITIPTLAVGETYTEQYEVRVNMDAITTVTEISNKAIAIHNETQIESEEIKNVLEASDIRVTIKRADDEAAQLVSGGAASYIIYLENFSDNVAENLEMKIISDEYNVINIQNNMADEEQLIYDENKISINEISANGHIAFAIYGEIVKDVENLKIYAEITDSEGKYRSNIITEKLPNIEAKITLSSEQDNKLIKPNEQVTYNITIQNIGETVDGSVIIEDVISEYLQVEAVYINGEAYMQTINKADGNTYTGNISNNITIFATTKMETGETIKINIVTRVKEISIIEDGKIITNKAELTVLDIHEDTSEEVKHTLDCGQKNIINGFAWIDEDADGRKEVDEVTLSGITVKLYDVSTKEFLKDTNKKVIATQTGTNGEYEFTQIPNGSYIIVFEHGMENYEPTKYQAKGTESSENSKAKLLDITVNGEKIPVSGIKISDIQDVIITNANIGLKDKEEIPSEDGETENPDTPDDPDTPDNPDNPDITEEDKKEISGLAWLDLDRDGEKDEKETVLKDIKVKLYDVSTKDYLLQTITDANGEYKFTNIEKGLYIVIFEYDTEEYEPTTYLAEGVDGTKNSKVVLKKININGEEITTAVTDTINVQEDVTNINIGLREKLKFDLELSKYISRIVVQDSKETKAYDYEKETFAKVEMHRKRINGSLVVLEYTIKVKNNGEVAGYAKNIVDYLPSGLTFSSELNTDWYLSGNYLYTKGLENIELQPGEEKEIKLILTKTMTNENAGLINNRAEIYQDYNEYGAVDIDSTANNQIQNEDDLGSADVIILVSTGGGSIIAYIILLIVNMILIGIAIKLMIPNNIIKASNKRERR